MAVPSYFQQNAFPANFNSQPTFQQPYQPPINQNNMIWVSGEQGMRSYQVGPNVTLALWDSDNPVIYLKSADMMGKPSVKVLDYTVRDETQDVKNENYVSRDEFNKLNSHLADISNQLKQLKNNLKQKED